MAVTSGSVTFAIVKTVITAEGAAAKAVAEAAHAASLDAERTAGGGTTPTFSSTTITRGPHGLDEIITVFIWA